MTIHLVIGVPAKDYFSTACCKKSIFRIPKTDACVGLDALSQVTCPHLDCIGLRVW